MVQLFPDNNVAAEIHLRPQALNRDVGITDTGSGQLSHSIGVRLSHIPPVSKSQETYQATLFHFRNARWLIVPT